jgi:Tryptophan-associated transmembrane protein (Trp_oprn_chp)
MPSEILSTARPSRLRLFGFLALVLGALLAGLGATLTWATVGFPNDSGHVADVAVKGIDVWEGVAVLAIAAASLVGLIVMRITASSSVRLGIAVAIAVGGLAVAGIATLDLATSRDRFGGGDELDRIARKMADVLGQPVEAVRTLLERNFGAALRVEIGPGLWMALAGGVLLVVAGVLSFLWSRDRSRGLAMSSDDAATPNGAEGTPPA